MGKGVSTKLLSVQANKREHIIMEQICK